MVASPSHGQDVGPKLAAYMDAAARVDKFQGSVLVAKEGRPLLARGYGLADAEHDIAIAPFTKFRLGSITKQFTATAILILQDQGKLSVDDKISKHLADTPEAWADVTIHHLLTHTSGIPSYTDDPEYRKNMTRPETVVSMISRFRDKPLDFEPGSKFHYDNSGYFLLGAIIERVSGRPYEDFLRESIFVPLGMSDTGYDRPENVLQHRARGYEKRGERLVNAPYLDMNQPYAAGSLYSTVLDLLKWDRALRDGKLLSAESMKAMFKPALNNYAYGWTVGERQGHRFVGHGGGINGFATDFLRLPEDDVCVVVLCNFIPSNPGRVARDLAAIVFGESVEMPKERVVAKVDPSLYDDYAGRYEVTKGLVLTVRRDGDRLLGQPSGQPEVELLPESDTAFFIREAEVRFTFGKEDGKVTHVLVKQGGQDIKAKRLDGPEK
jgi:CubicO group peptidase (beta-lactamase class C family)